MNKKRVHQHVLIKMLKKKENTRFVLRSTIICFNITFVQNLETHKANRRSAHQKLPHYQDGADPRIPILKMGQTLSPILI